jgi:hypothetical protein
MRAMLIEPADVEGELTTHVVTLKRHFYHPCTFVFHGSDEPFHDGDTPMLPNGTEVRSDTPALAPLPVRRTIERRFSIRDDILGRFASLHYYPAKKSTDIERCRFLGKNGETYDVPREVIDCHGDPPTEQPALRERERQP